jgi:Tfp pilus assembly protein PilX
MMKNQSRIKFDEGFREAEEALKRAESHINEAGKDKISPNFGYHRAMAEMNLVVAGKYGLAREEHYFNLRGLVKY